MHYRRDEPFRFNFGTPIEGTFTILKIDGKSGSWKEGPATILDLSPNGIRFSTSLNLPTEQKKFLMEVSFVINEKRLTIMAEPKWKKRIGPSAYSYGLLGMDDETKEEIIEELKHYAKERRNSV